MKIWENFDGFYPNFEKRFIKFGLLSDFFKKNFFLNIQNGWKIQLADFFCKKKTFFCKNSAIFNLSAVFKKKIVLGKMNNKLNLINLKVV
jgi:hypothetical protein